MAGSAPLRITHRRVSRFQVFFELVPSVMFLPMIRSFTEGFGLPANRGKIFQWGNLHNAEPLGFRPQ
jgi:hypothetical protein